MKKFLLILALVFTFAFLAQSNIFAATVPFASCSDVNISEYVACAPGGKLGAGCEPVIATAKGDTYSHECSVNNRVEWVNDSTFKQYSNDIHFLYQKTGSGISFLQDTIWGGKSCDNGGDAIYRVYKGNTWGAEQMGLTMSCGETFEKPASQLKTYSKTKIKNAGIDIDGADYASDLEAYACNVKDQTGVTSGGSTQLIFAGQAQCCTGEAQDMAVVVNTSGPGTGEVYMYCKGKGLCAHYQSLNFADEANNPQSWGPDTDLCALTAGNEKDDYYLYPINGINNQNRDTFYADLINQGYQSYCYVPTEELQGVLNKEADWITYPPHTLDVSSQQKVDYSDAQVPLWRNSEKIKQLEADGLNGIPSLFDSLENYWGVRDVSQEDPLLKDISSAPIYSLLSRQEQCEQKVKLLNATNELCNKLENPASCALDRIIPAVTRTNQGYRAPQETERGSIQEASGYSFLKLRDEINANGFTCEKFAQSDFYDESGNLTDAKGKELADVLDNVPLYLDKAYRLGFLVVAAEVQDEGKVPPSSFNFLPFNFFTGTEEEAGDSSHHVVRVVAFRLPDIGTNRNPDDPGYYQDPLELTANSILDTTDIERYQKQIAAEKAMNIIPSSPGNVINPLESDTYYTQSDLVKALVQFVNQRTNPTAFYGPDGYNPKDAEKLCGVDRNQKPKVTDLTIDPPANDSDNYSITDKAGLYQGEDDKNSDKFKVTTDGGGNLIENLEAQLILQKYPPNSIAAGKIASANEEVAGSNEQQAPEEKESSSDSPWAFKFLSKFNLLEDREEKGKDPKIFTYLVVPQGYQLALAEDALSGLIYTNKEKEKLFTGTEDTEPVPAFLKLQNTGLQFFSDTGKAGATDLSPNPDCKDDLSTAVNECTQVEITAEVKTKDGVKIKDLEPRILGGRLGFLMRKIQMTLQEQNSKVHDWLSSLNSTEEYLMGFGESGDYEGQHKNPKDLIICEALKKQEGMSELEAINFCSEAAGNQCIDVFVDQDKFDEYSSVIKNNLPAQQEASATFAGWEAYYSGYRPGGTQYLFGECGGTNCIDYILSEISKARLNGKKLNPYLAIAIAINESGALKSTEADKSGPHFGCGVDRASGDLSLTSGGSIESKLECMIGFFNGDSRWTSISPSAMTEDEILSTYGYANGTRNSNLANIIAIVSNYSYVGCQ